MPVRMRSMPATVTALFGAKGRTRTPIPFGTRSKVWRVCQFRHFRKFQTTNIVDPRPRWQPIQHSAYTCLTCDEPENTITNCSDSRPGRTRRVLLLQAQITDRGPIYGYIPIMIFLLIAVLLPVVLLTASKLVQRRVFERQKLMPYECGVDPVGDARDRFSVRFYMVAMLFLVFDVETIFLFPWAVIYDKLALFGLIEMLVFIGVLVVGYYYAWRKGAFEWA